MNENQEQEGTIILDEERKKKMEQERIAEEELNKKKIETLEEIQKAVNAVCEKTGVKMVAIFHSEEFDAYGKLRAENTSKLEGKGILSEFA